MRGWIVGCALAEAVGMAAAAGAARASVGRGAAVVVALAVLGGLVEASGLGAVTFVALRARVPELPGRVWVAVTALAGGLAWAVGSVPGALGGDDPGTTPSLWLVLPGAAAVGLVSGTALGAAQALVLRHRVAHPARWITAGAAAWPAPMAVIFAGATTAGATWPAAAVVGYGALTGVVAGALLGAGYGLAAPALGAPVTSARSPGYPVPRSASVRSE